MAAKRSERYEAAVRTWVERIPGWDNGQVDVVWVPHLTTPSFDFFLVSQRRLGPAGEAYVMTDGSDVLPAGSTSLTKVLMREGFPEDTRVIPAAQLAELYLRMAAVRQGRVLHEASDFALGRLAEEARASFAPPRAEREGDDVVLTFWTAGLDPGRIERWRVRIAHDSALAHEVEPVT